MAAKTQPSQNKTVIDYSKRNMAYTTQELAEHIQSQILRFRMRKRTQKLRFPRVRINGVITPGETRRMHNCDLSGKHLCNDGSKMLSPLQCGCVKDDGFLETKGVAK